MDKNSNVIQKIKIKKIKYRLSQIIIIKFKVYRMKKIISKIRTSIIIINLI
jgi:hypothetical protein